MLTYRIHCRGGSMTATERDRFAQPDGESIPAPALTEAHVVPLLGRVLQVARVVIEERPA